MKGLKHLLIPLIVAGIIIWLIPDPKYKTIMMLAVVIGGLLGWLIANHERKR